MLENLSNYLNCGMEFKFDVNDKKLESVIFDVVSKYVIDTHIDNLINVHDSQLKMIIIDACTKTVHKLFKSEEFKEYAKKTLNVEIQKIKEVMEYSKNEYSKCIHTAIKEEVQKKVRSVVSEPGFDHYIMGCVQLEVKDKFLTIER